MPKLKVTRERDVIIVLGAILGMALFLYRDFPVAGGGAGRDNFEIASALFLLLIAGRFLLVVIKKQPLTEIFVIFYLLLVLFYPGMMWYLFRLFWWLKCQIGVA